MTAQIYQIRDFQSKKDLERMKKDLERQAMEIANIAFPSVFGEINVYGLGAGLDSFVAPEKDPA